jgi:hypothetical protein
MKKFMGFTVPQWVVLGLLAVGTLAVMLGPWFRDGQQQAEGAKPQEPHLELYYLQELAKDGQPMERRVLLIEALAQVAPSKAAPYLEEARKARTEMSRAADIDQKARQKAEQLMQKRDAARRKREGVSVGMTREEVLASSWGKPRKINRTTTALSEREQWVYPGGYLYFRNGVLEAIQN